MKKQTKINNDQLNISLYQLLEIYTKDNMEEDDDQMYSIKHTIIEELTPIQQMVFLSYLETKSLRKTALIMHCSAPTIMNIVKKIKEKIKESI